MACERRYEIAIRNPQGDLVDIISSEYTIRWTLRANKVGVSVLELPAEYCTPVSSYGISSFGQDYRIELWRYIDGEQSLVGNTPWFVNYLAIVQDENGRRMLRVEAESALGLAGRRTVAYKSNDNASDLNPILADNQLHRVMKDHFASIASSYNTAPAADPLRTAITTYLIANNFPPGPSQSTVNVEMNIAHQPVLQALGRIADASFQKGEPLFFDIWQISSTTNPFLEFITGINQLGMDRTRTTGGVNAIVLNTSDIGTINEYTFALDWRESAYRVYAGSQGRGALQVFRTIDDAGLADLINGTAVPLVPGNPFALREAYIGTNELSTATGKLDDQARAELARLSPKVDLHGTLAENETFQWGIDWDYHDRLTILSDNIEHDVFVETLTGELSDGKETITGTFATSLHRSLDGIARVVQDTRRLEWWRHHLNALEGA